MKLKFLLMVLLILGGIFQSAQIMAQKTSPEVLISNLYKGKGNSVFETKNKGRLNKYFTKRLADLIWEDMVNSRDKDEVGKLDFDPLYGAQETKITNLKIKKIKEEKDSAEVVVSFKNLGEKTEIKYLMALTKAGWRIDNIFYFDGPNLLTILQGE